MINTLKNQVEKILQEYPETRNSDITLMLKIWEVFHSTDGMIETKKMYELPRHDAVKRIRAKFCQENKAWAIPTDWKIAKARKINEEKWRLALGYKAPEKTLFFEVGNKVIGIKESEEFSFRQLNPNAVKLS